MPSWQAIVDVAAFVAAERPRPDWDTLYAADNGDNGAAPPRFCADRFDADVGEALAQRGVTGARVLDCGCGTGTVALELGRRGFVVSAVDAAPRALARARARPGSDAVTWIEGDVTDGGVVGGAFDVVIDRGCLHGLVPAMHARWATAMARLTRPGGLLLTKTLSPAERAPGHTHAFTVDELQALVHESFALEEHGDSLFQGPLSPPPRALFCVFRRR
jgi:2-polyprenyl-3-methyl-5-hydroxy-6-metoxy-1,4-benzoquinol methylase